MGGTQLLFSFMNSKLFCQNGGGGVAIRAAVTAVEDFGA
jgi:hypothetical protein